MVNCMWYFKFIFTRKFYNLLLILEVAELGTFFMVNLVKDHRFHIHDLAPAIALLALLLSSLAAAVLTPTGKDNQYIVVVAPWRSLTSVLGFIGAAEGAIVSINDSAGLITVYSENKDFPNRLYRAGVWLVFEPMQSEGCVSIQRRATTA